MPVISVCERVGLGGGSMKRERERELGRECESECMRGHGCVWCVYDTA